MKEGTRSEKERGDGGCLFLSHAMNAEGKEGGQATFQPTCLGMPPTKEKEKNPILREGIFNAPCGPSPLPLPKQVILPHFVVVE